MNIKAYRLKENTSINDLINEGFKYSNDYKYLSKTLRLKDSIVLCLKVYPRDFSLVLEVLDDDFCQYYIPFYDYKDNKCISFKYLEKIIERYNYEMDNIDVFEGVEFK